MSETPVPILFEREVVEDVGRLDEAWRQPPTFVFAADKSGVPPEWIERKLVELPAEFRQRNFILLTSGSTGRPKLVVGKRERSERLAGVLHSLQDSEPVRETVVALPLSYCYAFVNQWLWARRHGRRLVMTPGLAQPDRLKTALAGTADAMLCLVGAQVPMLMKYFENDEFPGVIRLHFAGGRFPQEQLDALRRLFPKAQVFNNYGCAEAMPRLTLRRAEAGPVAYHIGWTLPGVEMMADPDGRLLFRSVYGAVAMIDENGLTRVESDTWVPTGDLGRQLEDGHWELLGREGEVFKRYGEKVSMPQILTSVRATWRGLADCYREADRSGEMGYVLLLAPEPQAEEVRAILKAVSARHPRTHWPLRVESLAEMPLLSNGKIDRERLAGQPGKQIHWKQHI